MKLFTKLASLTLATAVCGSASAIPFVIDGASVSTSGLTVGSTIDIDESAGLAGRYFDLAEGESSEVFDVLDVTVSGLGVVGGTIDATLNFAQPEGAGATGVFGGFAVILGLASGGFLTVLSDPGLIAFGDGGFFDVDFFGFSDACLKCTSLSGTITAQISLVRAPTSVPEPATLSLLGAGLLALGFARRRKRA